MWKNHPYALPFLILFFGFILTFAGSIDQALTGASDAELGVSFGTGLVVLLGYLIALGGIIALATTWIRRRRKSLRSR